MERSIEQLIHDTRGAKEVLQEAREKTAELCTDSCSYCQDLLSKNGIPKKAIADRFLMIPLCLTIFFPLYDIIDKNHIPSWETSDQVRWTTQVSKNDTLIPVDIYSQGGLIPARSYFISVRERGKPEELLFTKNCSNYSAKILIHGLNSKWHQGETLSRHQPDLAEAWGWNKLIHSLG